MFVYIVPHFYDLPALVGCLSSVSIRRIIYKFRNVCPFDYTVVMVSGKVELVNRFNNTSRVAVVIPTDRPKSIRHHCVIECFGGVFVLSRCFLNFSVGVAAVVIGLNQISSFLSLNNKSSTGYNKCCRKECNNVLHIPP